MTAERREPEPDSSAGASLDETPDQRGPQQRRTRLLLFGQVIASTLLLAYLVSRVEREDAVRIRDQVLALKWSTAVPLALFVASTGAGSVLASAYRLQAVARCRGTEISLGAAVYMNCLSLLAAVFMPLGLVGDALRIVVLVRRHEVALRGAVGVVVTDRLAGLTASCAVAILGLVVAPSVAGAADVERMLLVVTCLMTLGVAAVVALAAVVQSRSRLSREGGLRRTIGRFEVVDLVALRSRPVLLSAIAGQLLEVASAIALVRLFGFQLPPAGYIAVVSSFLPVLEALPAAFVGIGAREGALEYLLVRSGEPTGSGLVVGAVGLGIRLVVVMVLFLGVARRPRGAAHTNGAR